MLVSHFKDEDDSFEHHHRYFNIVFLAWHENLSVNYVSCNRTIRFVVAERDLQTNLNSLDSKAQHY